MKNIYKNSFLLLFTTHIFLFFMLSSCSSTDDSSDINNPEETSGLIEIQNFSHDDKIIYLYTKTGKLKTGYNEIYIRIKNTTTGTFESDVSLSWFPLMHMANKTHSCPFSNIEKVEGKNSLYKGFILFQMASNDTEFWELKLNYTLHEQLFQISEKLTVLNSPKKTIQGFTGTDNKKYLAVLATPNSPFVGANDITAYLYKMQDMNTFTPVNNYTIKIDPRMPDMGNHSSPNNINLLFSGKPGLYSGKISLTMTGYWKINLIITDPENQIIKGEPISETNESSSIFWEIEL